MKSISTLALAALLTLAPVAAFGHAPSTGVHGGMQTHAGPLHQELVIKDGAVTIYLNNTDDQPVETVGATGTVTLLLDGTPVQVALAPGGANSLSGKLDRAVPAGTRITTTVTLAGKGALPARYEWKPAGEAAAGGHEGHAH
ncbi:hypothetical protein [Niveispirillum sp. KHB5.9]|uniref:hypothetical protein n=1 Tax=Niveispirillum sp. KHB5.9 TaxID=3400269 RepID=UPI003A8430FA